MLSFMTWRCWIFKVMFKVTSVEQKLGYMQAVFGKELFLTDRLKD